jgi:hypothetical protein
LGGEIEQQDVRDGALPLSAHPRLGGG